MECLELFVDPVSCCCSWLLQPALIFHLRQVLLVPCGHTYCRGCVAEKCSVRCVGAFRTHVCMIQASSRFSICQQECNTVPKAVVPNDRLDTLSGKVMFIAQAVRQLRGVSASAS